MEGNVVYWVESNNNGDWVEKSGILLKWLSLQNDIVAVVLRSDNDRVDRFNYQRIRLEKGSKNV